MTEWKLYGAVVGAIAITNWLAMDRPKLDSFFWMTVAWPSFAAVAAFQLYQNGWFQ